MYALLFIYFLAYRQFFHMMMLFSAYEDGKRFNTGNVPTIYFFVYGIFTDYCLFMA